MKTVITIYHWNSIRGKYLYRFCFFVAVLAHNKNWKKWNQKYNILFHKFYFTNCPTNSFSLKSNIVCTLSTVDFTKIVPLRCHPTLQATPCGLAAGGGFTSARTGAKPSKSAQTVGRATPPLAPNLKFAV